MTDLSRVAGAMKVFRSGNSLALRLPALVARALGLSDHSAVEFDVRGDELVLRAADGMPATWHQFAAAPAAAPDVEDVSVRIDGQRYLLDVRFRMLQPRELARAQGFPDDYVFEGNKSETTAMIGNAVPEKVAYALGREALVSLGFGSVEAA
jgi:site-specific DNA-cytosine methylase